MTPLSSVFSVLPSETSMFCPSSTSARVSSSGRPRRKVFFSSFLYSALTLEKSIPPASCTPRVLRTTRTSSVVRGLGSDALTNGEAAKPFEPIMVILSAPMLENWPTTTFCSPSPRDMSATTAVMPMKMPIMVSRLRNLLFPQYCIQCVFSLSTEFHFLHDEKPVGAEGYCGDDEDYEPVHSLLGFQLELRDFIFRIKLDFHDRFLRVL